MEENLEEQIRSIVKQYPRYYFAKFKLQHRQFLNEKFPDKSKLAEQIYLLFNGKDHKCCICGSTDLYFGAKKPGGGYSETCSKKCGYKLREKQYTEKYGEGITNARQLEETKQKFKDTCEKKYGPGITNPRQAESVKKKVKETYKIKTGYENPNQNPVIKAQKIANSNKKYGVDSPNQVESIKKKQKEATEKNWGVSNISQHPDIKKKKEQTNLEKLGVPYAIQSEDVQKKRKQRCLEKNGVPHTSHLNWSKELREILFSKEKLKEALDKMAVTLFAKKYDVAFSTVYNYASNVHGLREVYTDFSTENIVKNILDELGISNYIKNDRTQIKPKEIDFYLPDYKIGFEICGLKWHSEKSGKNSTYHLNKLNLCENAGIRLVTIFEDELSNYDKLRNRLSHILNRNEPIAYARNCTIKEVTNSDITEFLNETHMQNSVNAKICYAAYFKDEIVAVMTFGSLRKSLGSNSEENVYEMLRYSCSGSVPGIASKLFKTFIRKYNPKRIISYCDRRWSQGNLYVKLGFTFEKYTSPNYWYLQGYNKRQHRFAFTKHKVVAIGGNPQLTEWQNMLNMGYDRIWDCGSAKFVWSNPSLL